MGYVKIDDGKMMELAVSAPLGIYGSNFGYRAALLLCSIYFPFKRRYFYLMKVNGSAFTTLEIRANVTAVDYNLYILQQASEKPRASN
jgi:hypothetical protein